LTTDRTKSILADAAYGSTLEELAKKWGVCSQRIDQIFRAGCSSIGVRPEQARRNPELVIYRLRNLSPIPRLWQPAQTPEEFFAEVFHETRVYRPET
jgi:hypothetical protein